MLMNGGNAQDLDLDTTAVSQTAASQVSDADLEYLNQYLASSCFTLINVGKDLFYKELHLPQTQATLRTFASDKKLRTLVIARIDKGTNEVSGAQEDSKTEETNGESAQIEETAIEIQFNLKVQYLG